MGFSYNKLWKLLIDRNMNKTDLKEKIKTSSATIAKMSNDEYISMRILEDICKALECDVKDIVEYLSDDKDDANKQV